MELKDIYTIPKLTYYQYRHLPFPFDQYAVDFRKWVDYAKKQNPHGKGLLVCACTKTILTKDESYVEEALKLVEFSEIKDQAYTMGLAGIVFSSIGQEAKGIQMLRNALQMYPSSVITLSLAARLDDDEDIDEGIQLCKSVLKDEPDNINALGILSMKYLDQDEYAKAEDAILHAIKLDPKNKLSRENYGDIFFDEEKYRDALREYKKARSFLKCDPYLDYRYAVCYYKLGKLRMSRKYIKRLKDNLFETDPFFMENSDEIKQWISDITVG